MIAFKVIFLLVFSYIQLHKVVFVIRQQYITIASSYLFMQKRLFSYFTWCYCHFKRFTFIVFIYLRHLLFIYLSNILRLYFIHIGLLWLSIVNTICRQNVNLCTVLLCINTVSAPLFAYMIHYISTNLHIWANDNCCLYWDTHLRFSNT